jgi:hypothetical protein
VTGRAAGGVTRALERALGRCAGLLPPGRRGWADAVRAEAAEVPAGRARLGWVAGGMWLVAREAQMTRRIAGGLGTMAVAVAALALVAGIWPGVAAAGWDKARLVLLVVLLAGLPWVARRRGVFGPVAAGLTAPALRAAGCAAVLVLVLDIGRMTPFPDQALGGSAGAWDWVRETVVAGLIAACLAAVLIVTAWWPQVSRVLVGWCAAVAGLALFLTLAPVQVLITVYVAGILAVTTRRSLVTPATLAICVGVGVGGGLLMLAMWNTARDTVPGIPGPGKTDVQLLVMVLVVVAAAATAAAGWVAARLARGPGDPVALSRAWFMQCLAAGPLTGAIAALVIPFGRVSDAVRIAAACPASAIGPCTNGAKMWMIFLVAGPVLGLAVGRLGGAVAVARLGQPPAAPPREPRPGGSRSGGVFVSNS